MSQIPLVVVVGPTASGKTRLAIELCKALDGEVVSGDSMQLYRRLSIATAKPTPEEQEEIPHHLIDMIEPTESFSVAQYTTMAHEAIAEVYSRGKMPVVAGGTGLYIRSLIDNITFAPQRQDMPYREELRELAAQSGNKTVHDMLAAVDPDSATAIHHNNLGRVIRALEVFHISGTTMTEQQRLSRAEPSPYLPCVIGISYRDRDALDERINMRVGLMIRDGLVDEVAALEGVELSPTASQAIGYKELLPYLDGSIELEAAVEDIRLHSRQYAKRQMTWFRREKDIHWLWADDYGSPDELVDDAVAYARQQLCDFIKK